MPPSGPGRTSAAAPVQRRSASSAARRSGRPSSAQPSSSSAAAYPPSATGSAPGVATTRAGSGPTVGEHLAAAPLLRTGVRGKARPSSSAVRRDPTTVDRSRWPSQDGQSQAAAGTPHQRQAGARVAVGPAQRSAAGRAAGRRPAGRAGEPGQVAAARHLDEDRPVLERAVGGAPGQRGQPGAADAVVGPVVGAGVGQHGGGGPAYDVAGRGDRAGPAGADQAGALGGARQPADHQRGALDRSSAGQDRADVRVGRARLGVQVVAVVPDHGQAEVMDGGEHRGPGAEHGAHLARGGPAASAGSARPGPARRSARRAGRRPTSAVSAASTRSTSRWSGQHDQGAPAGGQRGGDQPGQLVRPGRAGQRRPDAPGPWRRRARRRAGAGPES